MSSNYMPGPTWGMAPWEEEEAYFGHTYRSEQRDSWPAALKDLRAEFENGRVPKDTRERTVMCRACSL